MALLHLAHLFRLEPGLALELSRPGLRVRPPGNGDGGVDLRDLDTGRVVHAEPCRGDLEETYAFLGLGGAGATSA